MCQYWVFNDLKRGMYLAQTGLPYIAQVNLISRHCRIILIFHCLFFFFFFFLGGGGGATIL